MEKGRAIVKSGGKVIKWKRNTDKRNERERKK